MSEYGLLRTCTVVFVFYLVLDFWLARSTGRSVLFVQHVHLPQILDGDLSLRSSRAQVSLSLDTVEDVMVGEVDELEEDVG